MKEIPLYGKYSHLSTLVDDEDYEAAARYRWLYFLNSGKFVYSRRTVRTPEGGWRHQLLHTFITGWPLVDHINHDGLDNRRSNLRPATRLENVRNKQKQLERAGRLTQSQYKGVTIKRLARGDKWRANICIERRQTYLGTFVTEIEAARAYDQAARRHFGAFACLNFPEEYS